MSRDDLVLHDGAIELTLDLRVYRMAAVKKAAYRFADRFTAVIGSPNGDTLPVRLMFKPNTKEATMREIVRFFYEELLDQELREEVAAEVGPMRMLILAQAFSKTDLIRRE